MQHVDPQDLYQRLGQKEREAVHHQMMEIGHDRPTCKEFGIDYLSPDPNRLLIAACYELELFK